MGIRIHPDFENVKELSRQVAQVRQDIDRAIVKLSEARRRLPGPDAVDQALTDAPPEGRHELSNACISLELALEDTLKWAYDLVAATRPGRGGIACDL